MLAAFSLHVFLFSLRLPSGGCGVAGLGLAPFGVNDIGLMVFPVVKAVNAVFVLFQKAAFHQGGNELMRVFALPSGFQGNVGFVHAL